MCNILVIKHGALGDIVLATAGFAAIRAAHPSAHITLLTTKPYADLLAQSPYFNEIWVDSKPRITDRKAIARLREMLNSKRFDWVFDLQISGRSTLYPWLISRPWPKISNVSRFASHGFTDPIRHQRHSLDNIVTQLGIAGIAKVGLPDVSWMDEEVGAGCGVWGMEKEQPLIPSKPQTLNPKPSLTLSSSPAVPPTGQKSAGQRNNMRA